MPDSCSAWGCTNRRTIQTRSRGITFHRFPKEKELRRQWEVAARRKGSTSVSSVLCSAHFKPEDIDRTGQTVRIRDGAKPSVFKFPTPHQRTVVTRTTKTSRKAEMKLPVDSSSSLPVKETKPLPSVDHSYALPSSPSGLKSRLSGALARVERLERELRNVKDRERRAKTTVHGLLKHLKRKNLMNKQLKEKLDLYSDLPVHLLSKQGHDYTKDQKEFALSLHIHGPEVYNYLREALNLHLPHPHTLQRWKPIRALT